MTARGFGKRDGELEYNENYIESKKALEFLIPWKNFGFFTEKPTADQQDDYRDESFNNRFKQKQLLLPFTNQFIKNSEDFLTRDNAIAIPQVKGHRLQLRDGTLKFRLNDGNLRIGRGYGKRTYGSDPYLDKYDHAM